MSHSRSPFTLKSTTSVVQYHAKTIEIQLSTIAFQHQKRQFKAIHVQFTNLAAWPSGRACLELTRPGSHSCEETVRKLVASLVEFSHVPVVFEVEKDWKGSVIQIARKAFRIGMSWMKLDGTFFGIPMASCGFFWGAPCQLGHSLDSFAWRALARGSGPPAQIESDWLLVASCS